MLVTKVINVDVDVTRTVRIDIDWLFERIKTDKGIFLKYVNTKEQLADILTKGSFTAA